MSFTKKTLSFIGTAFWSGKQHHGSNQRQAHNLSISRQQSGSKTYHKNPRKCVRRAQVFCYNCGYNKYIFLESVDQTIRTWNFWEKTQDSDLQGHLSGVTILALTYDNKLLFLVHQTAQSEYKTK